MIRLTMSTFVLATLAATGCGFGDDQAVSGTVARASFPEPVTQVRAVGTATTVEANVGDDGSFTLFLPEHDRYRIELVSAVRQSDLVFPRGGGVVDTSFYVEAARDTLDLGGIRYIGDIGTASSEGGTGGTESGGGTEGDGGSQCGGDVDEPAGASESGDAAVADANAPAEIGCGDEGGGGQDTGTGGTEGEGGGGTGG